MNFEEGPQLGIRGNIANRNFRYLLRVNGRLMNNKGHYGAKSELEQWNLDDIQKIEIVRGPGSVTYGPGAVAGVINITTHNAESAPGLRFSTRYMNQYDSKSLTVSHGYKGDEVSVYTYAGITRTPGDNSRQFTGTNDQMAGYVGEDILMDQEPLDYFSDFQDQPQLKFHIDVEFREHWRFWSRYTQQGSTWRGNETRTDFGGELLNQQSLRDRQWTNTLQYERDLREDLHISTMFSIDSFDVERRADANNHPDPGHAANKRFNFSETEIYIESILNWQASEKTEIAFGMAYSYDRYGPGWGDDKKDMILGEDGVIVSGPDSNYPFSDKNGNGLFVGDGWDTNTISFFAEGNIKVNDHLRFLISARTDKNTYSGWLFSPRIALISEVKENHYLKLIAQQSQRMGTAGQLYALDQAGNDPDTETVNSVELIYSGFEDKPLSYSIAGFWNGTEVIAWNQDSQASDPVGDLQVIGMELEVKYQKPFGTIGVNYSLINQLDWDLEDGVAGSGISYADYNQPLDIANATLTGLGNDLNNWPNQSIKMYTRANFTEKLTAHVDARWMWDFQGALDGLDALSNAVTGLPEEAAVDAAIAKVYAAEAYDHDFRLDALLNYQFKENFSMQIFAQNLLSRNDSKRYSYDTGNNKASPKRARFTEEPRTIGIGLSYEF